MSEELITMVTRAKAVAHSRRQPFSWSQKPGAAPIDISECEVNCGLDLSQSHKKLLSHCNGAILSYGFVDNPTVLTIELLSTKRIENNFKSLRDLNDGDVPSSHPEDLWKKLIPVFDLMDSQFLFCEDSREVDGEFEVFFGYLSSSPSEWRGNPAFAPDVFAAIMRILRTFIVIGSITEFC